MHDLGSSLSRKRECRVRLLLGLTMGILVIVTAPKFSGLFSGERDLYVLSSVAILLASSSLLAEALGLAAAVVELVLGTLAGVAGLTPVPSLELLGLIGSVFIMYVAGLEIDPHLLRKHLLPSLIGGLVSFAAPAIPAYLAVRALGYGSEEALLASIGTATTSVAVVYAIIRQSGLVRRPLGQVIIAVAMVADVTSILAFVAVITGITLHVMVYFAGLAIAVYALARLLEWAAGGENEIELRLIIAFLISAALVSESVGVHAILFAFLLGVATRNTVIGDRDLESKVSGLTFGMLAPIFFVDAGLHAAPRNLLLYAELSILLLLITMPTKVLGTHLALRALMARRVRMRLTTVFGARLTVSTIIAFTGEATGVLSHDLAGSIITSALIATVIAGSISRVRIPPEIIE
ncbi:MAG: cation:proton antiporter [Desulfurococcales archaeon]|nr:cation:proton antiporter [Desulfurococcales archaeon]